MKPRRPQKPTWQEVEDARLETLRADKDAWICLLESLLVDAQTVALRRGDWGLCECLIERDKGPEIYQSDTCARVIQNIQARHKRNNKVAA